MSEKLYTQADLDKAVKAERDRVWDEAAKIFGLAEAQRERIERKQRESVASWWFQ